MNLSQLDRRSFLALTGATLATAGAARTLAAESKPKTHGLVVGHPEGADAGMQILADGGNAIDAIVAAALVAGVVGVSRCGIGGYGGHMTIGLPDGKVNSIDFNSEAPAAAHPDMFPLDEKGNVKGKVNMHGWLAAGVPATLAGLQLAHDKFGSLPLARLLQPAIKHARDGFAVYWPYAGAEKNFQNDPGSKKLFYRNAKLLQKGDTYRNPDLADMLQRLAEQGSFDDFYHGKIARKIADAFKKNGGLVTADDLANYRALEVEPNKIDWNGHTIATAPLTAGGLTILQAIATLKALGWDGSSDTRHPTSDTLRTHTWIEALRIAWGDRLQLFGDPRFVDVPIERLLSDEYARESAKKVQTAVAEKKPVPVTTESNPAHGTVDLAAVDSSGLMANLTLTHGDPFGAQVTVDGLGLILGHGMSRFEAAPDKLNSVAPGKRPLDNMCPTVVLRDGKPVVAIGAVGGRRIVNAVFQNLLALVHDGRSLEEAITEPRIHTEGGLALHIERGRPESEIDYLKQVGYKIYGPQMAWVAAVQIESKKNKRPSIIGAADSLYQDGQGPRDPHPQIKHAE